MRVKTAFGLMAGLLLLCGAFAPGGRARAGNDNSATPWLEWDKGPADLDVSSYPQDQQQNYKLFITKCSLCHSPARALNAPFSTSKQWRAVVSKMQGKPGSGLNPKSAKAIFDFLVYESGHRPMGQIAESSASSLERTSSSTLTQKGITGSAPAGADIFQAKCVTCHASTARGNPAMAKAFGVDLSAMDLRSGAVRDLSDSQLAGIIRDGKAGKMPSWKGQLDEAQIKDVIAYLRSLGIADTGKERAPGAL